MLDQEPILFTYDISVFGRKIDWYLTLRGIKYSHCTVRNRLPREELESLGVAYRRIPVLAIGRDIYCDTRCIIDKLEKLLPAGKLGSESQFEQGFEKILSAWSQDAGPFWRAAACIPHDLDVMQDSQWTGDRSNMIGRPFSPEALKAGRAEALVHEKIYLESLEHGLLADGRHFIFGGEKPTLADLEAIWPFDWLTGKSMKMGESIDPGIISDALYPKVYTWIYNFRTAVKKALGTGGQPKVLSGHEAIQKILAADFWQKEGTVDESDPLKLEKGQMVQVYATDNSSHHRDVGKLVSLGLKGICIESKVKKGDGYIRLHFPRVNFRIEPLDVNGVEEKEGG